MGLIEKANGFRVPPVETLNTTRNIQNGWAGIHPLPVVDIEGDMELSTWVLPRKALKAWMRDPHVLQLVRDKNGSLSMSVVPIQTVKSQ